MYAQIPFLGIHFDPQVDPRFDNAVNMIRKGVFGWEGYFEELLQTLSGSRDYYLVANDFPAYLLAQVHVVSSCFETYQKVMTNYTRVVFRCIHFPATTSSPTTSPHTCWPRCRVLS